MAKEPDVARVAAAFNTPGLKYRSFGNMPVRHEAPRGETANPHDPETVLRELRSSAAAARLAAAEAATAEATVMIVPEPAPPPPEIVPRRAVEARLPEVAPPPPPREPVAQPEPPRAAMPIPPPEPVAPPAPPR
ncbi:MAG: hypothetical protein JWR10_1644, partial [Rubritepida sp.]|nr:hypothetical protein [Rubritepida sp.]